MPWSAATPMSRRRDGRSSAAARLRCRTDPRSGRRRKMIGRRSSRLRWLLGSAGGLAVVAAGLWTAPRWLVPWLAARSPRCLYAVATRERVVALTIDDGPDAAHGPAILRLLREHGARATFFLISGRVA